MGVPYIKDCKDCGRHIRMAQLDTGQWLPFELNGSGKHQCGSISSRKSYSIARYRVASEQKDALCGNILRIIFRMLLAVILIKLAAWFFVKILPGKELG